MAAAIAHPHVVRVYEFGEDNGRAFMTTDRPKRCWPPVEGAKVTVKDEGPYSWSGSREVEVPVTAPPLDDTANPAS
jgi:hypothetical protein